MTCSRWRTKAGTRPGARGLPGSSGEGRTLEWPMRDGNRRRGGADTPTVTVTSCGECRSSRLGWGPPRVVRLDGRPAHGAIIAELIAGAPKPRDGEVCCSTCGALRVRELEGAGRTGKQELVVRRCEVCERWMVSTRRTLYCSERCRKRAAWKRERQRRHDDRPLVTCEACGEPVPHAERRTRRYCSHACRQRAYRERST